MKKEQSSKNIIIPYLIGFVYFVYALIMFIVPRCRYNDAKNEHETMKPPNSAIIAFHFVFHIVFTALIIGIIGCFHNYFTHFKCKCFEYFTIVMFAGGCGPSLINISSFFISYPLFLEYARQSIQQMLFHQKRYMNILTNQVLVN